MPYHLSDEQIRSFDEQGFLILRKRIQGRLLERVQDAAHQWIEEGLRVGDGIVRADQRAGDYAFANRPNGKVLFRVNYIHAKGQSASLELLGSPQILGIAESLAGPNFAPTYESMVFKMPGDGEAIPWHQDAVFPRSFRAFNTDLYLDASRADAGALRVVPRSHKQVHNVCQIRDQYGWNHPDQIVVEMEPGDLLIHDDMVLHGSPRVEGRDLRRTVYFEFRPVEQVLAEGPFDDDFLNARLRLIPVALRAYQTAFPDEAQFRWNADAEIRPQMSGDDATELRIVHTIHTPGSYCAANRPSTGLE
jgi:hypothetical protein